jgi:hypothetical protein
MSEPLRLAIASSIVAAAALAFAEPALSQDAAGLYDKCFTRTYSAEHLAKHPGQRVSAISINFQSFEDDLLASVVYTLRYGTKFGFSGACYIKIEGGFSCEGCVNDSCESNGEKFKILWSGGDTVRLVNEETGMLAENAEGGRDYLAAGGEHAEFVLRAGSPEDCAW